MAFPTGALPPAVADLSGRKADFDAAKVTAAGQSPDQLKKRYLQAINDNTDILMHQMKKALGTDQKELVENIDKMINNFKVMNAKILSEVTDKKADGTATDDDAVTPHFGATKFIKKAGTGKFIKDPVPGTGAADKFKNTFQNILQTPTQDAIAEDDTRHTYIDTINAMPRKWKKITDPVAPGDQYGYTNHATEKDVNRNLTKEEIETRLKNCYDLEVLYLTKHQELMQIFLFTVNLFERYKYAIKVILYLLKHLAYGRDEDTMGDDPSIVYPPIQDDVITLDVPKAVIQDITLLLKDQKKVRDIIKQMDQFIGKATPITHFPKGAINPTAAAVPGYSVGTPHPAVTAAVTAGTGLANTTATSIPPMSVSGPPVGP